uniref:Uncharacterized protein n=1 Tax=Tanacetum cinerariifolium TaxID=118510 RepID=A0A6L2J862_TANCI|nr:hypothetical protein [Tanacetum cinerariifolium]
MAESSNLQQSPPSNQEQILQQEQQPESPILFEPAPQVRFNIEDIIFNPNNKVALLHPPRSNSKYFKAVSDFISKCCLKETFTRSPSQYKEYLLEFWYTDKPKITPSNSKPNQVFSAHNWALKKNQPNGPPFTKHILDICKADVPIAFKSPKPSSKTEKKVTQGTKLGATTRRRKKQIPFTYNHPQCKINTTKGVSSTKGDTGSQTGHSMKETHSSSAMDSNPIQPLALTLVVAELHKEA